MPRYIAVLPVVVAIGVGSCSQERIDAAAEGRKLLQRDAQWAQAAFEGKDVEKIVSYWSDDALVVEPGQPVYEGKAAIRRYVTASLQTPGFKIHWVSRSPVFSPDGQMAYMPGTAEITVPGPGPTGAPVTVHVRGVSIWRRDPAGEWYCVVDIGSDAPPAS